MKQPLYETLKVLCLLSNIVLIIVLCVMITNLQMAIQEEKNTQVFITRPDKVKKQKVIPTSEKPLTRDLNNIPKSDYKVPEIG